VVDDVRREDAHVILCKPGAKHRKSNRAVTTGNDHGWSNRCWMISAMSCAHCALPNKPEAKHDCCNWQAGLHENIQ
jgi:hypothetical protein